MLSFFEITNLCEEINPILLDSKLLAIYELDTKKWVFLFEKEDRQIPLLICAQTPYNRFHLLSSKPSGKSTPFTQRLEERLKGSSLKRLSPIGSDRILQIAFENQKKELLFIVELCFKKPQILLATGNFEILESFEKTPSSQYTPPEQNKPPRSTNTKKVDSYHIEKEYEQIEREDRFQEKLLWIEKQLQKKAEKALNKLELHKNSKEEAKKWEEVFHLGQLLQSHFHLIRPRQDTITLPDWQEENAPKTLSLDPHLSAHENIEKYFKSARKLKKTYAIVDLLIKKAEEELALYQNFLTELKEASSEKQLNQIIEKAHLLIQKPHVKESGPSKRLPFRSFKTAANLLIFVGRSDLENDTLSFSFANGSDLWFHAANTPGSHVVLKKEKKGAVDEESIQDALQLALYFSKAKARKEDDVVMTECKFLSKSKSAPPGQVQISKHQTIHVRLDEKRLNRLFTRLIQGE